MFQRGQKSKNLPKSADFGHFFFWGGRGAEPLAGGAANAPYAPFPLDAATELIFMPCFHFLRRGSSSLWGQSFCVCMIITGSQDIVTKV